MDATNRNLDFTIHEHLDRFFGTYRNGALQERAAKALDLLLAHKEAKEVLVKKPAGWAGGIVYAVGSRGVGVPGLLNRELETAFGVRMAEIYRRAAKVKDLLGADLPSPSEAAPMPEVFTLRDEANAICAYAFRNGFIEDIHADGRISDEEMKRLMIQASDILAKLLAKKHDLPAEYQQFIRDYHRKYCRKWER